MYLYVELWKARQAWRDLNGDERRSWLEKLLAGLQEQLQAGVEPVGIALNDGDTPHSVEYDFIAVWKMPDKEAAQRFENFVGGAGWHDYFEQVNARGRQLEMEEFVSAHLNA